jgi:hypothetical protein
MAANAARDNEKPRDNGNKQDERGISTIERGTTMIMLLIKEGVDGCSERPCQDGRGPEEKNALSRREDSFCFRDLSCI